MISNAIYALTPQGAELARKIAGLTGGRVFLPSGLAKSFPVSRKSPEIFFFDRISDQLAANFQRFRCHIMICASGIAVRALAPLVQAKDKDPAVLLLDQGGRFVISLLSGHLGGANGFCRELAASLGATPVITTATDTENLPAIDELARERKLRIINLKAVRHISAALLRGETPWVVDIRNRLKLGDSGLEPFFSAVDSFENIREAVGSPGASQAVVLVNPPLELPYLPGCHVLILEADELWLGIGCRRGTGVEELETFVRETLEAAGFTLRELDGIASIDLKQDEPGLLELAKRLSLPLRFFSAAELDAVPCPNPSERVREATGSGGVCEAAALLAAGYTSVQWMEACGKLFAGDPRQNSLEAGLARMQSELLLQKTKGNGVTLALARGTRIKCGTR